MSDLKSQFKSEIPFVKLAGASTEARDVPLRAKSVCLAEKPRTKYGRAISSADPNRLRYPDKQFIHRRPQSTGKSRRQSNVIVKQQNRKVIEKIPFAVSIQTLSIPMKYADNPKPWHSTSKASQKPIDSNKTKHNNPSKQVNDNKRLCQTIGGGKETQNKLLMQISEAEQLSDFERILKSNAIQCERARRHVWRGCVTYARSASVVPRPRSSYSLYAVSQAYHYLFQQHEDSLQPLIDEYRQATRQDKKCPPSSLLEKNWYENLQDLSEFYEDDQALKKEVETITDRIISEEVKSADESQKTDRQFNVNLADLFGLRVNAEGFFPSLEPSPDVEKISENENEEEWLTSSMNAHSDDRANLKNDSSVDCLTQNLEGIQIDSDSQLPTISFSNCCDAYARNDISNNSSIEINLTVPSIDSIDESRPPMM